MAVVWCGTLTSLFAPSLSRLENGEEVSGNRRNRHHYHAALAEVRSEGCAIPQAAPQLTRTSKAFLSCFPYQCVSWVSLIMTITTQYAVPTHSKGEIEERRQKYQIEAKVQWEVNVA